MMWATCLCLVSVLMTVDGCWWNGPAHWGHWGSCSAACGGGTRERRKNDCGKVSHQRGRCHEICYNGGRYDHGCHCNAWRSGRCCEGCRQGTIAHCRPGKQVCGGNPDSVRCTGCDHLFRSAGWGKGCERKPCDVDNGGCDHTCTYIGGLPTCSCRKGFQLQSNQYSCLDINECTSGTVPCTQTCINMPGTYECSCGPGYNLDIDGYTCSGIDQCLNGTDNCEQLCLNKLDHFECDCRNGYTINEDGWTCNDTNECSVNNGGCDQICINVPGSYHCQCESGYVLTQAKKCTDIDECAEGNARCTQNCTNTPGRYLCHCKPGFELEADGFSCSNIDDCIDVTCLNGGTCTDHLESYSCVCRNGYKGDHCEYDINECVEYLNGGCEDRCINTDGSYKCSCFENRTLDVDKHSCSGGNESSMSTVFERESIPRRFLPHGCHKIILSKCDQGEHVELFLSSTSSWYKLFSNSSIIYTDGVVFVELNDLSLPISITGITVIRTELDFRLRTGSLRYGESDGIKITDETQQHDCWSFDVSPRDMHDFISSNSLSRTFLSQLDQTMPSWLQFSYTGSDMLQLSDFKSELIRGSDVDSSICSGAPVHYDRLYTMLIFNRDVSLSFYGETVALPNSLAGKSYCFLIDICRDLGSTLFLLLPPESRDVLDQVPLFANLNDNLNIRFLPRGIGLSMKKSINAHAQRSNLQFWNGDRTFQYPLSSEANFWIGGDVEISLSVLNIQGGADLYFSIPSPEQLQSGLIHDEWNIQLTANAKASLNIPIFDEIYTMDFGEAELDGYGSIGGEVERSFCGQSANPPGLFLSLFARLNPFLGIPILETFILNIEAKMYVFVTFGDHDQEENRANVVSTEFSKEMLNLKTHISNLTLLCRETSNTYDDVLSAESHSLLMEIDHIGTALEQQSADVIRSLPQTDISTVVTKTSELSKGLNGILKKNIELFTDSIEFGTMGGNGQLATLLYKYFKSMTKSITTMQTRIFHEIFSLSSNTNGFGIKSQGKVDIFGFKFIGVDIEIVYSVNNLGQCSQYENMFKLLHGERALRMKISLSVGLDVTPFIKFDVGHFVNLAFSIETPGNRVLQAGVVVNVLGITVSTSITISQRELTYRLEGHVWDTFLAELQCSSYHNEEWYQLVIDVQGKFLAQSDDGSSFHGSYLDGVMRTFQKIADEASARISAAQGALTTAQSALTFAQNWLESKKEDVRDANRCWDDAVHAFEIAKDKLEDAKGPFNQAIDKLNAAQRKVDSICRIRTCRKICLPGIKCRICHKSSWIGKLYYPCCHFTDCMISFPDPICTVLNIGCRAIRGLAYIVLEAAKIFVRIPILVLDAAKYVVTGAQMIVDKSRILLDVAIAAIDLAKFGLEAVKVGLEAAKYALEAVKFILKGAVMVINFIIKEGIQRIIDVKDCQFHIKTGFTVDQVFDVSCKINPFMLGWVDVGIRINFKDIHRSLWNAAKGTSHTLVQHASHSSRRRRDLSAATLGKIHTLIRNSRDMNFDSDDIDVYLGEKINAIINTPGMRNASGVTDYECRVNIFAEKCETYKHVSMFMIRANDVLKEIVTGTADILDQLQSRSEEIESFDMDRLTENLSFEGIGLNTTASLEEFNITTEQIETEINKARTNLTNNPVLSQIPSLLEMSKNHLKQQQDNVDNVKVVTQWFTVMENVSKTYFDNGTCVSFIDCMHYSITTLYSLHEKEHYDNVSISLDAIAAWEDIFVNLTFSDTHTIQSVRDMSLKLQNQTDVLEDSIVFCSTAPTITVQPSNVTTGQGATVSIFCKATGDPKPDIWWYRNEELLENETEPILTICNVTENDTSMYSCVAGNIVANLTSDEAHVLITDDVLSSKASNVQDVQVVVIAVVGSCSLFAVLAGLLGWRRYKRLQFKKQNQAGSVASLNMIRPYSAPAKPVFDSTKIKPGY